MKRVLRPSRPIRPIVLLTYRNGFLGANRNVSLIRLMGVFGPVFPMPAHMPVDAPNASPNRGLTA